MNVTVMTFFRDALLLFSRLAFRWVAFKKIGKIKMKNYFRTLAVVPMLCMAAQAQVAQPVFPPGNIAVFKAGTTNGAYPMITARVAPVFVQAFDPTITNQLSPVVSVAMST